MHEPEETTPLSPWWWRAVIYVMIAGFAVLSYVTIRTYTDAPPIPGRVAGPNGETVFTRDDIVAGQQVFMILDERRQVPRADLLFPFDE